MKKDIFKSDFYKDRFLALNVLNELNDPKYISEIDMYTRGEFLFFSVKRTQETEAILSKVIRNIDAYVAYDDAAFIGCNTDEISLCALHDEYTIFHRRNCEIKYNNGSKKFYMIEY